MNKQDKQLYEALKTARNYLLQQIDIFHKLKNKEHEYIDIDTNHIKENIKNIRTFMDNINILEQRGYYDHIIVLLNDYIVEAREDMEFAKSNYGDSNYFLQKIKDRIKIYTSKINDIDHAIETLVNKQ